MSACTREEGPSRRKSMPAYVQVCVCVYVCMCVYACVWEGNYYTS